MKNCNSLNKIDIFPARLPSASSIIKAKSCDSMYVVTDRNYEVNAGENLTLDPDNGQIHCIAHPDSFDSNNDNIKNFIKKFNEKI